MKFSRWPLRAVLAAGIVLFTASAPSAPLPSAGRSLREFGVLPANSPSLNKANLQAAIDWASTCGAALFLEPSDEPYPMAGGLILRRNVSLIGVHGPVGRGTRHAEKAQPVGSVFQIEDESAVFLTVESATQVRGIQFWYPQQEISDPALVKKYPATIQVSQEASAQGVTLACLTFYGEYLAMDFRARAEFPCEQILIEHCYGYPLGGEFIRIDRCFDIPRLLHCHVNPGVQRLIRGDFNRAMIDAVVARKTFAYAVDHADNAQLMDLFAFGVYGGVFLGPVSYGQLTNFNFDCVTIGIEKQGDNPMNRNWQVAQGSIIANTGSSIEEIHPIVVSGQGHLSLSNVEAFSAQNPGLSTIGRSQDFLLVRGEELLTISMTGCRMRDYSAASPISNANPRAAVQAQACVDRDGKFFNQMTTPSQP